MKRLFFILFLSWFSFVPAQSCAVLDAGEDVTVTPANNATTLIGSFNGAGIGASTDTYTIESASLCDPGTPVGAEQTIVTTDDVWSSLLDLPFDFEYFGNAYNSLIVGGNGVVSFDTNRDTPRVQKPNEFCQWLFDSSLPSNTMFMNTIYGAYHDMDITYGGSIKSYISGTAPFRRFVVKFDSVAQFACNSLYTTQHIILNETTNIVEVYIQHKDTCTTWNYGNAVIGIQNELGDVAYVPPGRNTGVWEVQTPEYWRFVPATNPQTITPVFTWYNDATNVQLGTGLQLDVVVDQDTTFRLEASFVNPATGQQLTVSDTVTVYYDNPSAVSTVEKNRFQIIPNPVENTCQIKFSDLKTEAKVQLIDMSGKLLMKWNTRKPEMTVDLTALNKGVYLLQVQQENQIVTSKLMKR